MDLALPLAFELTTIIVLVGILIADLLYVLWRPHVPSMREATLWAYTPAQPGQLSQGA
jgi:tellurite resistance protein TerC